MENVEGSAPHQERPAKALAEASGFQVMPVDLFEVDPRRLGAARMEIVNPLTKLGTGQFLWLLYNQHPKVQGFLTDQANAELATEAERASMGKAEKARKVEEGIERSINLLCIATENWEQVFFEGKFQEFNVANLRKFYSVPFVREQAVAFMKDIDNFTKG